MKKLFIAFIVLLSANAFAQNLPSGNVEGLNVGNIAPDIVMCNPAGDTLRLSSLRGKMVLLDFWASWCAPCRRENPFVVKAYRHYKDSSFVDGEGFTVFSVSLDNPGGKTAWTGAIAKDSLEWPYHVSDLNGWSNAAAQKYGIFQIPTNYLIDGNGVILAKNLMDESLPAALRTMVVKKKKADKKKAKKAKKKKGSSTDPFGPSFGTLTESMRIVEF